MFDLSSLLGTGSQDILQQINKRVGGGSFFGSMADPFRDNFNAFMTAIRDPIRKCDELIRKTRETFVLVDEYRPITSVKDLKRGIPPCMRPGIVTYEPIRELLNEERIDGFGYDPKTLPAEDPYKNLCESGCAEVHSTTLSKDGTYTVEYKWDSTDPVLTPEQALDLSLTRQFIDFFMLDEDTRHLDFTDYPSLRG
jgi:hypothetical protein